MLRLLASFSRLSVSPARGRGRDALSCGWPQGDTAHQSQRVEIEAASRWRLGGRQLPKEVLSRKHLCSLITPLLFITTAKHRVQVITVNHILLPFIILSLGKKTMLCFWRHPCCRPWLFISWVQRLKCAVITFWILGFTWPRRNL